MREIKFRAWRRLEEYNKMYYLTGFVPYGEGWHGGDPAYKFYEIYFGERGMMKVHAADVEIMQYTGLKDKNGKEIYEGDIVKTCHRFEDEDREDFETVGKVDFSSGAFWITGGGYSILQHFHFNNSDREVIGNIYETPELIKPELTEQK